MVIIFSITGIAVFILLITLIKSFFIVRQGEVVLIERLGRYVRTLTPGVHIVLPFVERPRSFALTFFIKAREGAEHERRILMTDRVDLRESVHDFPKQRVITKDNVLISISAIMYYQITDPYAAVYSVANLSEAIELLTQTTLRNVIGSLDLDQTLVSRDMINERLRGIVDEASHKWGVSVKRVELQEVAPPRDIQVAMEKQMRAERDRRAIILEAEGAKQARILEAEGVMQADVLKAQGSAEAQLINAQANAQMRLKLAQAESEAIKLLASAMPDGNPVPYMISQQYVKAFFDGIKDNTGKLVVVPYDSNGLVNSVAMVSQMLQNQASTNQKN